MASNPFEPSHLGANIFDIYNDNTAAFRTSTPIPQLPSGACNYVDLTPGGNGSKCGCRRFWVRQVLGSPIIDQAGWCMCNHHACYHDEGARDAPPTEAPISATGQENERPRTGREPLSPVLDVSMKVPPAVSGMDYTSFGAAAQLSFIHKTVEETDHRSGTVASPYPTGSLPDTLAWCDIIQSQGQIAGLPPIPPQCLMPSQTASSVSSIQTKYLRPFSGKGLQTLSSATAVKMAFSSEHTKALPPTCTSQQDPTGVDESFVIVSADEGATNDRNGTCTTQPEPRASTTASLPRAEFKNLTDTVGAHAQRLDRLETVSFSAAAHDECQDKHDHLDLRVTELESRVEEVERMVIDNDVPSIRRGDRNDDAATQSVVSVSTSATSRPTHSQEMYSQLHSLQAQVTHLQSAMPSHNHPREVEVVFLPFPLKRVWHDIHQFKADPTTSTVDDWTQLPNTHSSATMRAQSPFLGDWVPPEHDAEWLLPRACSDKSIIDKRLRSRGLIKKLSIHGSDARSIQVAMNNAFGDVFREMQILSRPHSTNPRIPKFYGLQSAWVPLRKLHKDSRLRFLNRDEMLTPTLWTMQFLDSIMMKSAEPRLFVTHPDAYLQDYYAYETGWTWQKLRETSRVYPDLTESREVPEADALEEYWVWNEQLDDIPGTCKQRVSLSPQQAGLSSLHTWSRSVSPVVGRGQTPLLTSYKDLKPPHIRTSSVPIVPAARQSPATVSAYTKRRAVSYGQSRRSSPSVRPTSQAGIIKRRRTRSPSHPVFTPRWTASPSPMPLGLSERQGARGTTPFAYATPYSNAPLQEIRTMRSSSLLRNEPEQPLEQGVEHNADYDMYIYESDSNGSYGSGSYDEGDDDDDDASIASAQIVTHIEPTSQHEHESQSWPLPEDEPWPGIEDRDRHQRSDGENIDPHQMSQESEAEASSQPSEYPSTQRAWPEDRASSAVDFRIHEDDDDNDEDHGSKIM